MSVNRISVLCAISAATLAATAGTPIEWASPVNGNWNLAGNWNPAMVPGMTDTALLAMSGPYTVSYDTTSSIAGLMVTNPNVQLDINAGRFLTMLGDIDNEGTIVVKPTGVNVSTSLDFSANAQLDGSGRLVFGGIASRARLRTFGGAVLTHGAAHKIEGRGQIEAEMVNNGLVEAGFSGGEMLLISLAKTNNATMRAIGGGILDISSITVTQGAAGDVFADGVGSEVQLTNATLIGGDLMGNSGGSVQILGASVLDGVRFSGAMDVPAGNNLLITNSIENNGAVTVNPTAANVTTTLRFLDTGSFNGTGTLTLGNTSSRARLQAESGMTITNGPSHSIVGRGQIEAIMVNNGTIHADVSAGEMLLNLEPKTNNALMQATGGAVLDISGISVTQSASGDIIADGVGSQVELTNSTVIGGDVMGINGADVEVNTTGTLDGVVLTGALNVPGGSNLFISNSIENNGVITVNPAQANVVTTLKFLDSSSLNGSGTLVLTQTTSRSRLQAETDMVITNGASHTIRGRGQIEAEMVNNGTVIAEIPGSELLLNLNDKTNNATMQAVGGAILDISAIVLNQSASGELVADGAGSQIELSNSTIDGGSMSAINGGIFESQVSALLRNVDFSGTLVVPGGSSIAVGFGALNNGVIDVNPTLANVATSMIWDEEIIVGGAGTVRLNSTTTRARLVPGIGVTQGGLGTEQRLEGLGQIAIDLINHGTIAPGLSIGTMTAIQPIFNSSAAVFEAEVDDTGADLLDSTSTIEIHGTLDVSFINGFAPTGFWSRTVMEGSSITGQFDAINEPTPTPGLKFRYYNTGTEIRIGASCAADIDLNNALDVFDVFAFLDQFNAQDPLADLQPDGVFDIFDVFAYLAAFNAGGCG